MSSRHARWLGLGEEMTTTENRVKALEIATGSTVTDTEAEALALQQMPYEDLERKVREILANRDPPAADDMSEAATIERNVRKQMARRDAERART